MWPALQARRKYAGQCRCQKLAPAASATMTPISAPCALESWSVKVASADGIAGLGACPQCHNMSHDPVCISFWLFDQTYGKAI